MFATEDDHGTSYYFRGAADDNWVQFADFYWRIIRINGDGTIKLIYSGSNESGPVETGESTQIGESAFNQSSIINEYVGYMYTLDQAHGLENDSIIKTVLDEWYQNNLVDYNEYISVNSGFCGDRTTSSNLEGIGTASVDYGSYLRVQVNRSPSLNCENNSDLYTTSLSSYGNKALTHPIGLITADEAVLAGGYAAEAYAINTNYYLYTGQSYWTMSPVKFSAIEDIVTAYMIDQYGGVTYMTPNANGGVRPVINLSEKIAVLSGDGSINNPYILQTN